MHCSSLRREGGVTNEQSCPWLFTPHLDKKIFIDLKRRRIKLDYTHHVAFSATLRGKMSLSQPLSKAHAARSKAQLRTTAVQHFHSTVSRKDVWKLTHLTADASTSKVHARMTQPTFIFANPRAGDKRREKRWVFFAKIHLSNSRSPVSCSRVLRERPSLLVWRKSAADTEMLRSVQRKPVPIG